MDKGKYCEFIIGLPEPEITGTANPLSITRFNKVAKAVIVADLGSGNSSRFFLWLVCFLAMYNGSQVVAECEIPSISNG